MPRKKLNNQQIAAELVKLFGAKVPEKSAALARPMGSANRIKVGIQELRRLLDKMPDPNNRALVTRHDMMKVMTSIETDCDEIRQYLHSQNDKLTDSRTR